MSSYSRAKELITGGLMWEWRGGEVFILIVRLLFLHMHLLNVSGTEYNLLLPPRMITFQAGIIVVFHLCRRL